MGGDGIVNIAKTHTDGGDFVQAATDHINNLYAYGLSTVLFKPTLAAEEQFRPTFDKALSYFVASNNACPEDKGFAIKGWTAVRFDGDIITIGSVGMAMTKEMIEAAQKAWGDGIVTIATAHTDEGDFVQAATDHINNLYAYGRATVLFKPTLAAEEQ